jgi:hypothetical protein
LNAKNGALKGAKAILERCLGLSAECHFVLLLDDTAVEVLDPLFLAAQELDVQLTTLFYSLEQQRTLLDLGNTAKKVIADADAALLAHTDRTDCSGFRTKLVSKWRGETRLGTMPGAKRFILETAAEMDDRFIVEQCWKLTLPLLHGRDCLVTTFDRSGHPYQLRFQLGGIDRIPVQSTGILGPHAWGNVPSGEIFTAPLETSAEGEYLVNGAIGTFTLAEEEAILTFREGRLVQHRFVSSGQPVPYLADIHRLSEGRGDKNWNVIAEFGIGVNQGIREVTGFTLLDEKMFGSVHIAVGNNKGWQGENEAQIHLDVITKGPTVAINGKAILELGQHVVKPEEFDDLTTYQPPQRYCWPLGARIGSIFRDRAHRDEHGVLRIELPSTQSGRVTEAPLADERTRQLVSQIQRSAGRLPSLESLTDIDSRPLSPELLHNLLSLLWSYGLIQPEQK